MIQASGYPFRPMAMALEHMLIIVGVTMNHIRTTIVIDEAIDITLITVISVGVAIVTMEEGAFENDKLGPHL